LVVWDFELPAAAHRGHRLHPDRGRIDDFHADAQTVLDRY